MPSIYWTMEHARMFAQTQYGMSTANFTPNYSSQSVVFAPYNIQLNPPVISSSDPGIFIDYSYGPHMIKSTAADPSLQNFHNVFVPPSGGVSGYDPTLVVSGGTNYECDMSGGTLDNCIFERPSVEAAQPKQKCPDCKGTKVYKGLCKVEPCGKCGGQGEV